MKNNKAARGPIEKIAELEQTCGVLIQMLTEVTNKLKSMAPTLSALVDITGADKVQAVMDEQTVKRAQESLLLALQNGELVKSDAMTEESVVVGIEANAEGVVNRPGYSQVPFSSFLPAVKEQFLGKGIGEKYIHPEGGGSFVITEIYEPAPKTEEGETVDQATAMALMQPEGASEPLQ